MSLLRHIFNPWAKNNHKILGARLRRTVVTIFFTKGISTQYSSDFSRILKMLENHSDIDSLETSIEEICCMPKMNFSSKVVHTSIFQVAQQYSNFPKLRVDRICDKLYAQGIKHQSINLLKPLNNSKRNETIFDLHDHNRHSVLSGIRFAIHTIQFEQRRNNLILIFGRGNKATNQKANIRSIAEEYLRYELLVDFRHLAKGGALHLDRYSVYKHDRKHDVFLDVTAQ